MLIEFFINKNALSEKATMYNNLLLSWKKISGSIDEERLPVLLLTDI